MTPVTGTDGHEGQPDMSDHTCDDALKDLQIYLDGELDEALRMRIEVHLRGCSPCLEAFDFEAELRRVIADRSRDRCPEALRQRILAELERCAAEEPAADGGD